MAIAFAAGVLCLIVFLVCRRLYKTLYAPKSYSVSKYALVTMKSSYFGFFKTVLRLREDDMLRMAGTDAVVFLEFIRLAAWVLTSVALPLCVILVPIDVTYKMDSSAQHTAPGVEADADSNPAEQTPGTLMYLTMGNVQGPRLWAHVVMSYVVTIASLLMIYFSYKKVIRLRQAYFASSAYQTSYFSRTLMVTDLAPDVCDDAALRMALKMAGMVYPVCEAQMGYGLNDLPQLMHEQQATVCKLEKYLDKALRSKRHERPMFHPRGWMRAPKVDAIAHYGAELAGLNAEIAAARSDHTRRMPRSYGFASVGSPAYAHATARMFARKQPPQARVRLAPPPSDILWLNLMRDDKTRKRSRRFANVLVVLLFVSSIIPLLAASAISNLNAFSRVSHTLEDWQNNSPFSFALLTGVIPPLISFSFALLLPMFARRVAMYRGVRTRQSRDLSLTKQYFTLLFSTQFIIFSLLSVVLDLIIMILAAMRRNDSASEAISRIARAMLDQVSKRFQFLSAYWMTWLCLKGFLMVFELAQVSRLVFFLFNRHVRSHNPRTLYNYTKAPMLSYWMRYAELLFLCAIGLIYAPLAPLVTAIAAGVFWLALFVYKNQLFYVYATKSESGGRLWSTVINCLLAMMAVMDVIVALAIGLLQNWVKAIICLAPIALVAAFAWYCRVKLQPQFLWYDPSPLDVARARVFVHAADRECLAQQFGNVFLHQPLERPIVDKKLFARVREFYDGPVVSSDDALPADLGDEDLGGDSESDTASAAGDTFTLPFKTPPSSLALTSVDLFDASSDEAASLNNEHLFATPMSKVEREGHTTLHMPDMGDDVAPPTQPGDEYAMIALVPPYASDDCIAMPQQPSRDCV